MHVSTDLSKPVQCGGRVCEVGQWDWRAPQHQIYRGKEDVDTVETVERKETRINARVRERVWTWQVQAREVGDRLGGGQVGRGRIRLNWRYTGLRMRAEVQ